MVKNKKIAPGNIINNKEICQIFLCGSQGGMRRSLRTNTLVLISDHVKSLYDDRWEGNIFYYTGMGQAGDQSLEFQQNKTLAESAVNGVHIHLFECFQRNHYLYIDQMCLIREPFVEDQLDRDGNNRKVYVFPLQAKNIFFDVPKDVVNELRNNREQQIQQISDNRLRKIVLNTTPKKSYRECMTKVYSRNMFLSEWVKRSANGFCCLCLQKAPFLTLNGDPYLETHHIVWLSKGGDDSLENMVALCPNCHRKMHQVNDEKDVVRLKLVAESQRNKTKEK